MLSGILRTGSLLFNQATQQNKMDQILPGIFVGGIPTKSALFDSFSHTPESICAFIRRANFFKSLKLTVSVVEEDELKGQGFAFTEMAGSSDWADLGVKHCLVPMVDYTGDIHYDKACEALLKMYEVWINGGAIYIHCKAGKGRSIMLVRDFLAAFVVNPTTGLKFTLDEAFAFLKEARPVADTDAEKDKTAEKLLGMINRIIADTEILQATKPENFGSKLCDFLVLPSTKKAVLESPGMQAIIQYAIKTEAAKKITGCKRAAFARELVMLIKRPFSEQWFFSLLTQDNSNPLFQFRTTRPKLGNIELELSDAVERDSLTKMFFTQVFNFVSKSFDYTSGELTTLIEAEKSSVKRLQF